MCLLCFLQLFLQVQQSGAFLHGSEAGAVQDLNEVAQLPGFQLRWGEATPQSDVASGGKIEGGKKCHPRQRGLGRGRAPRERRELGGGGGTALRRGVAHPGRPRVHLGARGFHLPLSQARKPGFHPPWNTHGGYTHGGGTGHTTGGGGAAAGTAAALPVRFPPSSLPLRAGASALFPPYPAAPP